MKARRPGFTLATSLLVVSLGLVMAMAMASTCFSELNVSAHRVLQTAADNLADSAIASALGHVLDTNGSFGNASETIVLSSSATVQATVTFDSTAPGIWSTNNINGTTAVHGFDGLVPAGCLLIAADSQYEAARSRHMAVFHAPALPYAIVTSGVFDSTQGVIVGGVASIADLPPDLTRLLPSDAAANSTSATSVSLPATSRIAGDLWSSGGGNVPNGVVAGTTRWHAAKTAIPKLTISDYDPASTGFSFQTLGPGLTAPFTASGLWRASSDVHVTGPLMLDNGLVYVDGALQIDGAVSGRGAVFATGAVSMGHGASMNPLDQLAVACGGNLTLSGDARDTNAFQGLLYTEGDLSASHITLAGAFIANATAGSTVQLDDVAVISVPGYDRFSFNINGQVPSDPLYTQAIPYGNFKLRAIASQGDPRALQIYLIDANATQVLSGPFTMQNLDLTALGPKLNPPVAPNQCAIAKLLLGQFVAGLNGRAPQAVASAVFTQSGDVIIDPSQFISLADRLRLLQWRAL